MPDLEKIIKDWESILSRDPLDIPWELIDDTLTLLKEQEKTGTWKQIDDDTNIWSCSECDEPFILMDGTPIENKYYYCQHCGVKMGT